MEKNGITDLSREHFSFSTKVFIGEFLKPTGVMMDNGEEKYVTLGEKEMLEDVDKIRAENGWKPRKVHMKFVCELEQSFQRTYAVVSFQQSIDKPSTSSGASASASSSKKREKASASPLTQTMTPEQELLVRLQAEMTLKHQMLQQQEDQRVQKEALRYGDFFRLKYSAQF